MAIRINFAHLVVSIIFFAVVSMQYSLPQPKNQCTADLDFDCGTGSPNCIPGFWQCDNVFDCQSGKDEQGCSYLHSCESGKFMCRENGYCIAPELRCNGENDCHDSESGSDERACHHTLSNITAPVFEASKFNNHHMHKDANAVEKEYFDSRMLASAQCKGEAAAETTGDDRSPVLRPFLIFFMLLTIAILLAYLFRLPLSSFLSAQMNHNISRTDSALKDLNNRIATNNEANANDGAKELTDIKTVAATNTEPLTKY